MSKSLSKTPWRCTGTWPVKKRGWTRKTSTPGKSMITINTLWFLESLTRRKWWIGVKWVASKGTWISTQALHMGEGWILALMKSRTDSSSTVSLGMWEIWTNLSKTSRTKESLLSPKSSCKAPPESPMGSTRAIWWRRLTRATTYWIQV